MIPPHAFEDPYGTYRLAFLQPQEWRAEAPPPAQRLLELVYRRFAENGWDTRFIRPFHARKIAHRNLELIDRIGEVTGASVVIDSTKGLERFHLLNRFRPARTIVLLRDPRGLAASAVKYGRDPHRVLESWILFYGRVYRFLSNNGIRPIVITYEDMCNAPQAVQERVAALIPASGPVNDFHLVAGNPSRYRPFQIKEDRSWQTVLSDDLEQMITAQQDRIAELRSRLRGLE